MKHWVRFFIFAAVVSTFSPAIAQKSFSENFEDNTLRFDFVLAGNNQEIAVFPEQMKKEPGWAGTLRADTDGPDYGTYRFRLVDPTSDELLFVKGFTTLFQEWQTTAEAKKISKSFYQGIFMPFPKKPVTLVIEFRNYDGQFEEIYQTVVDPGNYFIREETSSPDVTVISGKGESHRKVDLVFLGDGYTADQKEKFLSDVQRMTDYLFSVEPFDKNRDRFIVKAVWTPSAEKGTDVPGTRIYRNTKFNSSFYTFDVDRYLTTSDMQSVYDALSGVTWDHFFMLVNTEMYGGGGFYNLMGIGSTDHALSEKVMVHEFGHSFAGLGDEYYNSEVAYEDFYNLKVEPWEPNITTLVDFESKWKHMLKPGTPVPTPREAKFTQTLGVFEGGGYMNKGIYSPMMDCRMKSNVTNDFCPACQSAIQRIIDLHCE